MSYMKKQEKNAITFCAQDSDERVKKADVNVTHGGGGGGTWVNFCWVCAAGLSEPLPHYSLFCGQL